MAALSLPIGSRGAYWAHRQQSSPCCRREQLRTRIFGVSELSPATSFARRADAAKVRTAAREQLAERTAAPNGRPTAWRSAIVRVERVVSCVQRDGAAGGDVVVDLELWQARRRLPVAPAVPSWGRQLPVHVTALRHSSFCITCASTPPSPSRVHPFLCPHSRPAFVPFVRTRSRNLTC